MPSISTIGALSAKSFGFTALQALPYTITYLSIAGGGGGGRFVAANI